MAGDRRRASPLEAFLLPAGSDYFSFALCCFRSKQPRLLQTKSPAVLEAMGKAEQGGGCTLGADTRPGHTHRHTHTHVFHITSTLGLLRSREQSHQQAAGPCPKDTVPVSPGCCQPAGRRFCFWPARDGAPVGEHPKDTHPAACLLGIMKATEGAGTHWVKHAGIWDQEGVLRAERAHAKRSDSREAQEQGCWAHFLAFYQHFGFFSKVFRTPVRLPCVQQTWRGRGEPKAP